VEKDPEKCITQSPLSVALNSKFRGRKKGKKWVARGDATLRRKRGKEKAKKGNLDRYRRYDSDTET